MIRRAFLKGLGALGAARPLERLAEGAAGRNAPGTAVAVAPSPEQPSSPGGAPIPPGAAPSRAEERAYWVATLTRIADPVLVALSRGELHARMPVEQRPGGGRARYTHLEAFGRTLTGIAPWLELEADASAEGRLRARYLELAREALAHAVNPRSPDFMNFAAGGQPLVDAAFLAHALVKAPRALLGGISAETHRLLAAAFVATRGIQPYDSNWLLFSAMIEIALLRMGEAWDRARVDGILARFDTFYVGDGTYGDGPSFHWDYYNSFVMQPFLLDIRGALADLEPRYSAARERQVRIAQRYAEVQERLIAPDGSYPVLGRSIAYRFGAFQLLAQLAHRHLLPTSLPPGQVRGALGAVIRRVLSAKDMFDRAGWLRIGLLGSQPGLGEGYISTGSLYLCTAVFQPLGLPSTDAFWRDPPLPWTWRRAWDGQDLPADHALGLRPA